MTTLAHLYLRQGIVLETEEDWAAYEKHKAERRARNVANAREVLKRCCIAFEELGHRVGTDQLVAFNVFSWPETNEGREQIIAFWPEVGQWIDLDGKVRFGVRNLARYITGDETC